MLEHMFQTMPTWTRLRLSWTELDCHGRWEVKVALNYPALSLGKCCIGMLLLSHWVTMPRSQPVLSRDASRLGWKPGT